MKLRKIALSTVAVVAMLTMTACSGGTNKTANEAPATPKSEKVELSFWGWAPGYKEAVDAWNEKHPETQVKFEKTPSTNKIYPKMFTAVKAGNAPCLAQIEYSGLPSFVIQDGVEDITKYTNGFDKEYSQEAWNQVKLGSGIYGVPVGTAPVAFIYNKEAFNKYGLTVPKTWAQYRQMAEKVHTADPSVSLGYFSNDANWIAAMARQKGAKWFEMGKDSWKVNMTDEHTKAVADYWQKMIDDGLMKAEESYTPALYKEMAEGKVLSETFGIWDTKVIEDKLGDSAKGKWAVAPMPTWEERPGYYVSAGGSVTAILKGCKHIDRAVEFAHWMSTDPVGYRITNEKGGIWPASIAGLSDSMLDKKSEFYSDEAIYEPFKQISKDMKLDWTWAPLQDQVNQDLRDYLPKVDKNNTIISNIEKIQERAIKGMEEKNIKVDK